MDISNVKSRIKKSKMKYDDKDIDLLITDPDEVICSDNRGDYTAQYIIDNSPSSDKIWSIIKEDIVGIDNKGVPYKAISHRPKGKSKHLPINSYTVMYQYLSQPVNISYDIPLNKKKNSLIKFEPKLSYSYEEKLDIIYSVENKYFKSLPRHSRGYGCKSFDDLFDHLIVRELWNQPNKFEKLNHSGKYDNIIKAFLIYSNQYHLYGTKDIYNANLTGFTKFIETEGVPGVPRKVYNQIMMEYYILSHKRDKYVTDHACNTGVFILRRSFVPFLISFYTPGDLAKYNYTSLEEKLLLQ